MDPRKLDSSVERPRWRAEPRDFGGTRVAHIPSMIRRVLTTLLTASVVVACGASAEDVGDGNDAITASGITAKASDPCVATLEFLQKDAYVTRGRTSDLWPPHTTTVLDVTCQTAKGEQHIAPFKENYGTKPGTKDKDGNDMLALAKMDPQVVTTHAPWGEMKKLVASYQDCGCDPKGFLGLDTIDVEGQGLLESITPILSCPDSNEDLLVALKEKRWDDAKAMVSRCHVKDDVSPAELAKTAADVEKQVKELYSEHHLCNNNAVMQADLFTRFRDHEDATACDPHDKKFCYGPKVFFNPAKEIH
jgi:hypothetical protein